MLVAVPDIGGLKETQEMLDFCSKYDITSDIELFPILEVNEGLSTDC
jgi:uncharacterized zinc-type alcohol dehydrogenase-like protein